MKLKLLFAGLLSSSVIFGQFYTFNSYSETYQDLNNSTSLNNNDVWDDPDYIIPIGFDFQFFDTISDTIYISSAGVGGFLTFNNSQSVNSPMLIAYGADIIDRGFNNQISISNISYELTGTSGNQILKIEWQNVGFYGDVMNNGSSTDYTNFQLWLYEGSNTIEIHFGPNSIVDTFNAFGGETGSIVVLSENYDFYNFSFLDEMNYLEGQANAPTMMTTYQADTVLNSPFLSDIFLDGVIPNETVYQFNHTNLTANISEKNASDKVRFTVYPNPAHDQLNFSFDNPALIKTAIILNLNGQVILPVDPTQKTIDISTLPNSIYFIQITTEDGKVSTTKWVKI